MSHWQQIGREMGTDKATHTYMPVYERFLGPLASNTLNLLEIGVGDGQSLNLWLKLFPNASIFGLDYRPRDFQHERVHLFTRYQQDPGIARLWKPETFDVIVDDGGHLREWQRASRDILWPCLKIGGLYFIEDIVTDAYPKEMDHWRADPDCVFTEANCHDIFGQYERSDALVVLQKRGERPPHPLSGDKCLAHPQWPLFFWHMESNAERPYGGLHPTEWDVTPCRATGIWWDWINYPDYWGPRWEMFKEVQHD